MFSPLYFQRGSDELMSQSPMVTNGTGISPGQNEVNDAKKVSHRFARHRRRVGEYIATYIYARDIDNHPGACFYLL